jgi:rRNA-processing protein EBP2
LQTHSRPRENRSLHILHTLHAKLMAKQRTKRQVIAPSRPTDDSDIEDFATSDEEEINAAMADPKVKKLVTRHRAAFEGGSDGLGRDDSEDDSEDDGGDDDGDGSGYDSEEDGGSVGGNAIHDGDEFIYAGEVMREICADMTWGGADAQWKEGLVLASKQRTNVEDVENDLERELAFYNQALEASFVAVKRFEDNGIKWRRPDDYLAEMVKSDGHMAKVKEQLVHEQTVIEEAEQRRKERENRKYSKQVAAERRKERSQQKKQAIDSVTSMRKQRAKSNFEGEFDLDQVGLGDAKHKGKRLGERFSSSGAKSNKRQKRDAKYGFGGPKRRQKMNDSYSAAATDGPTRPNRAGGPKSGGGKAGVAKRPGKARRAAALKSRR